MARARIQRAASGALAAAALALSGCAHAAFTCEERGGPAWREVATPHFAVATDLDASEARGVAAELETARAALARAAFGGAVDPPGRLQAVVFAREDALRELAPDGVRGWFGTDVFGEPVVVLSGATLGAMRAAVVHELAHHLAASVYLRQPRWFAEGLATYLETLEVEGGRARVGAADARRLALALRFPAKAAQLFAWADRAVGERLYGRAWLLVHYLVNQRGDGFAEYGRRLARAEDPDAAWRASFPAYADGAGLDALDRELDAYARTGEYRTVAVPFAPPPVQPRERALAAGEVHELRLALRAPRPGADRRGEIAEALREDPGHPTALLLQARGRPPAEVRALAERATRAHPASWRAWSFLARALPADAKPEQAAAYRRAYELDPDRAIVANNLAWTLFELGRGGEALPIARAAALREPWSPLILDTYAAVVADVGRCPEAVQVQQRAVDLAPLEWDLRRELVARLERYRAGCGAARVR